MKKATKVAMIVASALLLGGIIVYCTAMSILKWDFKKLSTSKLETNTVEITEDFKNISVTTDTSDITFAPSEDGKVSVVCREHSSSKHSVTVTDGTLTVELNNTRKWYEYIGINFDSSEITVYLPKTTYASLFIKNSTSDIKIPGDFTFETVNISGSTGDVSLGATATGLIKIRLSTGDINLEGLSARALDLAVSTGKILLSDIECKEELKINVSTGDSALDNVSCGSLISEGDTGKIKMTDVIASGMFDIERSTGDVIFERCDASELHIETDTGKVKGSLLSDKIFIYETDTGRVELPRTADGGICDISTDTGDIIIEIVPNN